MHKALQNISDRNQNTKGEIRQQDKKLKKKMQLV